MGNELSMQSAAGRSEEVALMKAVLEGDVASMQTILQQKQVLIYAHSKDGENIWHAAAQGGHPEVSQSQLLLLVVMYAEQQQTTVQLACGPTMLITIIVDNRGAARMWVCLSACCQSHNSGQQRCSRHVGQSGSAPACTTAESSSPEGMWVLHGRLFLVHNLM